MLKRTFDIVAATSLLVLFAPLLLVVGLAILLTMGRPIIFTQPRMGKDQKLFQILKFRTLRNETGAENAQRVTGIGAFLRASSIDELPELLNVVKGDMSLVGPRPLIEEEAILALPDYAIRYSVLPGLTGLAQIRGRNSLTWDEKFLFDKRYVEQQSIGFDLRILMQTIPVVLGRKGINRAAVQGLNRVGNHDGQAPSKDIQENIQKSD